MKSKRDPLETKKSKKSRTVLKKMKGGPFSLVRFRMLRLKSENERGLFALT